MRAYRRAKQKPNDPYTKDGADPLELMARLFGRTSYRVPVEGRGTAVLLMAQDVAGAVGMIRDRLARETAVTVVKRGDRRDAARLSKIAYREVFRAVRQLRPAALDLHQADDRWRLRMVIFDATMELVSPGKHQPYGALAKAAKMRKSSYIAVHRCATAVLQDALSRGRSEFKHRLRGDPAQGET